MGRKRKHETDVEEKEKRDATYWAHNTCEYIASFPPHERDLINFFWPVVENAIDRKTNFYRFHKLDSETEKTKYSYELIGKFTPQFGQFAKRCLRRVQKEINLLQKSRDSPEKL
jgi:hypothetical protein